MAQKNLKIYCDYRSEVFRMVPGETAKEKKLERLRIENILRRFNYDVERYIMNIREEYEAELNKS